MGEDLSLSLDEKAKRTRDLLTSFYGGDSAPPHAITKIDTFHSIDTPDFDPERYMNALVGRINVEGLLQRHVEMAAEIKNLDSDLQMLVYENYNKFISATDTIRRMKNNVLGMETNMEQLLEKITSVQSKSDGVNASLFERRERIEKLNRTRSLLRKVQFIYDLPAHLTKCIKSEAYADAVKYYLGALPVFKAYGQSSFETCRKESEEAIGMVIRHLQARLFTDSEPVEARAEAVVLLKQLGFPVDNLKTKVLEAKLEHFLSELQAEARQQSPVFLETDKPSENMLDLPASKQPMENSKKDSIGEFAKTVTAYRIIFPNSEKRLTEVAIDLFNKLFANLQNHEKGNASATKLISALRVLVTLQSQQKETDSSEKMMPLQVALDSGKNVLLQGSLDVLWEIAAAFSGGGARSFEEGPPFVPAEICRMFRSAGENLMHLYIKMQTRKLSLLVRKSIATPNWVKYKEPRDVRMFVDLLLQE
ncbi:hypothetical protein KI387_017743, partial [Taxus chinensis]